jgi:hypothetical protein
MFWELTRRVDWKKSVRNLLVIRNLSIICHIILSIKLRFRRRLTVDVKRLSTSSRGVGCGYVNPNVIKNTLPSAHTGLITLVNYNGRSHYIAWSSTNQSLLYEMTQIKECNHLLPICYVPRHAEIPDFARSTTPPDLPPFDDSLPA